MRAGIRGLAAIGLGLFVVMGCGGGSGTSASPDGGTPATASADPGSSVAASPEPSTGGGPTGDVCSLVTTDELEDILDVPSVTTEVLVGPPDTCDVQVDNAPVAAWVLTPEVAAFVYDAYANDTGAFDIPGIGDKAAFAPGQRLLVVMKGKALLSMSVYDQARSEDEQLELMKTIAQVAVGRM